MSEPRPNDLVTPKIRLVKPLGAGGMGSVWLADHLALHTQVVVKFIAEGLANDKGVLARFEREAAAAAQVKSPHVVQILDHGVSDDGRPFMVMELLEGRDLANHLEKFGRIPLADVAEIVAQLSRALQRAHERGIVHRDIKPQNIFLCDAGGGELFVKLLDFGIAKGGSVEKLDAATKTGTVVGTPYYMSPEQLVGAKDVDFHTDLWSVGVVAFEAMTGRRAFDAETIGALAVRIHSEPLPLPSEHLDAAGPAVNEWFQRACARAPADRFGSAKEMADALVLAVTGEPAPRSLSASGSGPTPSVDPALALAKTEANERPADLNVLSYGGVERAAAHAGSPRRALLMIAGLVAGVGVVFAALSLRRGREGDDHVSPPASIVVPAAPQLPLPSESAAASASARPPAPAAAASSAPPVEVPPPARPKHHHHVEPRHVPSAAPARSVASPGEDDIR